jgi:hypothetical protein
MASSPRRIGLTITLAIAAAAGAVAVGRAILQGDRGIVSVTDFGAETGSRKNAVTAVRRALDACRRVRVEGNRVNEDVLGRNIVLKDTAASEVSVGPNQAWVR